MVRSLADRTFQLRAGPDHARVVLGEGHAGAVEIVVEEVVRGAGLRVELAELREVLSELVGRCVFGDLKALPVLFVLVYRYFKHRHTCT